MGRVRGIYKFCMRCIQQVGMQVCYTLLWDLACYLPRAPEGILSLCFATLWPYAADRHLHQRDVIRARRVKEHSEKGLLPSPPPTGSLLPVEPRVSIEVEAGSAIYSGSGWIHPLENLL